MEQQKKNQQIMSVVKILEKKIQENIKEMAGVKEFIADGIKINKPCNHILALVKEEEKNQLKIIQKEIDLFKIQIENLKKNLHCITI